MSLRINHNIASLTGHRNLSKADASISKSLEKLSSGLRINKAADDAAGLVISEQMRAQIGGLGQAIRNSETAVSMVQTAEGALDEVNTLLLKARDLALHAANDGANDQNQLNADQAELDNIIDSVNRIANNTQFGTKKILDGGLASAKSNDSAIASVKLGGQYTEDIASAAVLKGYHTVVVTTQATKAVSELSVSSTDIVTGTTLAAMSGNEEFQKGFTISIGGANIAVTSGTTKNQFLQQLNSAGQSVGFTAVISTGAVANGTTGTQTVAAGNIALITSSFGSGRGQLVEFKAGATGAQAFATAVVSGGVDAAATIYYNTGSTGGTAGTGAAATLALTGNGLSLASSAAAGAGFSMQLNSNVGASTVLLGAIDGTSSGATFQIGANVGQTTTVALNSVKASDIGRGASGQLTSLDALKGGSLVAGKAIEALKVIDASINEVTVSRGKLGAFQANTLEAGISNMRATQENLTAAESVIRDVDFAAESANFTKNNILVQAATAMLAQANQLPNNVLQLLG